jgi:hypothetical protein
LTKYNRYGILVASQIGEKIMAKTDIKVKITGEDGNAFAILGKVSKALKKGGYSDLVSSYREEAMSGDYNNLIRVTMKYVDVS